MSAQRFRRLFRSDEVKTAAFGLCSKAARKACFCISTAIICKILDLRFQALPDEITACYSSLGGEFGEWIDVVKDASQGASEGRPSQATGYGSRRRSRGCVCF